MSVFGFPRKNAEIIQVTWANVQAANVKLCQNLTNKID